MNYTQNYQLPQWEKTDRIMMDDFNDAMGKVDEGLLTKSEVYFGSYEGTDSLRTPRLINLGFKPKAVFLCTSNGMTISGNGYFTYGGLFFPDRPLRGDAARIVENGFEVQVTSVSETDELNTTFYYIAFK